MHFTFLPWVNASDILSLQLLCILTTYKKSIPSFVVKSACHLYTQHWQCNFICWKSIRARNQLWKKKSMTVFEWTWCNNLAMHCVPRMTKHLDIHVYSNSYCIIEAFEKFHKILSNSTWSTVFFFKSGILPALGNHYLNCKQPHRLICKSSPRFYHFVTDIDGFFFPRMKFVTMILHFNPHYTILLEIDCQRCYVLTW